MEAAAKGHGNFVLPPEAIDLADNQWKLITAQELQGVEQLPTLMNLRIENARPVEGLLGYIGKQGSAGRAFARIFNGNVERNPIGQAISEVSFNYASRGVVDAGNVATLLKSQSDEAFGAQLEKAVLRDSLQLDEVDARRLNVLQSQVKEIDQEFGRIRGQMSAVAKNKGQLQGIADLEEYGVVTNMASDQGRMLSQLSDMKRRRNALQQEIERLGGGQYGSPEAANKALADVRRYLSEYRDNLVKAAPDQELATHSQLMTLIAENQSLFSLTDEQKAFFDNYANFTKVDTALNSAFGVEYDPIDNYYVQHVSDWIRVGADGKRTPVSRNELANAFAERTIAQKRGFQFPRTFQNMLDWMRNLEVANNPGEWQARLANIIEGARAKGDLEEVMRLENLRGTDIVPIPRRQHFAETIAGRMAESYGARAEALAKAVADEFGTDVRKEVDDLLINNNISDLIRKPAEAAGFLRSALLRMDLSMVGVQGLSGSALMLGPNAGTREFVGTMTKVLASDNEFAKWWLLNGDRLSYWAMKGMVFAPNDINVVTSGLDSDIATDMLTGNWLEGVFGRKGAKVVTNDKGEAIRQAGAKLTTAGEDYLPFGKMVKILDKWQFARGITMMKAYTAEHLMSLVKAAKQDDGFYELVKQGFPNLAASKKELANMTDDQAGRFIAEFVNNIYGGRNRVMLGRSQAHQLIESMLMLTPGFTRGTLSTAMNTLKSGPQGALARDYALRSLMIAGGVTTLLSLSMGGLTFENGKPNINMPNLFDPSRDDWFDVKLPGGRTIRPMSRFRSLGRIAFGSLQEAAVNGNWEKATQYWTDDAMRWMSYRQSALISTVGGDPIGEVFGEQRGNSFSRNLGLKDILFNPSTDRSKDISEWGASNFLPVFGQSVYEQALQAVESGGISVGHIRDIGIAVGSELIGVGTFGPTLLESAVSSRAGELAMAAGLSEDVVKQYTSSGKSPVYARDNQNRYLLTSDQRNAIIEQLSQEFDISTELAARGGKRTDRERRLVADSVKADQLGRFSEAQKLITGEYEQRVALLDNALANNAITPQQYSEEITKLRIRRAGARWGAEQSSPAALAFLESDSRAGKQNATDAIYSAISQEAFAEDFIDPATGTFDFAAREQHLSNLEAKYGDWFYKWQARQDEGKTATELSRDKAYRTLGQYFDIADQAWQMTTGGALGASEREFDRTLDQMLTAQGVAPEYLALARSAIKQNIPVIANARKTTDLLRQALRALNPEVDAAAQTWLGALPLGY